MKKTKKKRSKPENFVFVDTNIYLDFYRANNEATLRLLKRLEGVLERVICTYQVEMEFLKNRQTVILESLNNMKSPNAPTIPAIITDSATSKSLRDTAKLAKAKTETAKKRLSKLLIDPGKHDDVYRTLEAVFHSKSDKVLTRDMPIRQQIKRRAWRRFILGYPPRKNNDTSIGDALNWEWIVECADTVVKGEIVIVSRDGDFGCSVKDQYYLNDLLKQEYKDRVGKRKKIVYTQKLSEALNLLNVNVPTDEAEAEAEAIKDEKKSDFSKKRTATREDFLAHALASFMSRKINHSEDADKD